jgi:hypothetical protein
MRTLTPITSFPLPIELTSSPRKVHMSRIHARKEKPRADDGGDWEEEGGHGKPALVHSSSDARRSARAFHTCIPFLPFPELPLYSLDQSSRLSLIPSRSAPHSFRREHMFAGIIQRARF